MRERQRATAKARWADPSAREKMITKMRAAQADPTVRQEKASADPEIRAKMIAGMRNPTKRRKNRDTIDC
jgi:hypothetical protein